MQFWPRDIVSKYSFEKFSLHLFPTQKDLELVGNWRKEKTKWGFAIIILTLMNLDNTMDS